MKVTLVKARALTTFYFTMRFFVSRLSPFNLMKRNTK